MAAAPDNFVTRTNLGMALAQTGRLDEADTQLAAAVQLSPDMAIAHDNLGLLRFQREMLPEAIACFQRAAELQPNDARYAEHLARARDKLGQ